MENPEFVTGIPLILLGAFGLFIAFTLFAVPDQPAGASARVRHPQAHPDPIQYVVIGLTLAFITLVEVALYYIDLNFDFLVVTLIVLSLLKFMLVVGFFMHLRFDSRIFSVLFFGGLVLAIAVFTVAITTLEAGLV
jgi:cytochrome c oxidase subunit IV